MQEKPSKVAVIRCESYDPEQVRQGIARGLDLLGGITAFVSPEEKITVWVNNSDKDWTDPESGNIVKAFDYKIVV